MPQGLQIFDANGSILVDTSTYVVKEFARSTVSAATNGNVTLPAIPSGVTVVGGAVASNGNPTPRVRYNSVTNKLDYDFNTNGSYNVEIIGFMY